jgi:hypothetical protein
VSKRSYRRLAAVTGAALAVGAMAPAMAARVDANGTTSANVDATDVTHGLPSVSTLVPTALVAGVAGTALSTVQNTQGMALTDVNHLMTGILGITGGLTNGGSLLGVNVAGNANTSANVLGAGVAVNGVGTAAAGIAGIVGGVAGAPSQVVGTALGVASPVVGTVLGLTNTASGLAQTVPGTILGTGGGLLDGGLGILGGSSVSGNVNVLASLMGAL